MEVFYDLEISALWKGYNRLRAQGYRHHRVHHGKTQVKGQMHTNTVEGFWSLLKMRIRAIHPQVSKKHLDYYLAEASFRYNLRLQTDRLQATFQSSLVPLRV
jgi:transposase